MIMPDQQWKRYLMTPLQYYRYLRREGTSIRVARLCVLIRFCQSPDDMKRRLNRSKEYWRQRGEENGQ